MDDSPAARQRRLARWTAIKVELKVTTAAGPSADYVLGAGLALGAADHAGIPAPVMHSRWVATWLALARQLPPA